MNQIKPTRNAGEKIYKIKPARSAGIFLEQKNPHEKILRNEVFRGGFPYKKCNRIKTGREAAENLAWTGEGVISWCLVDYDSIDGRVSWLEAIGKRRHEPVPISPQSDEFFPAAGSKKEEDFINSNLFFKGFPL